MKGRLFGVLLAFLGFVGLIVWGIGGLMFEPKGATDSLMPTLSSLRVNQATLVDDAQTTRNSVTTLSAWLDDTLAVVVSEAAAETSSLRAQFIGVASEMAELRAQVEGLGSKLSIVEAQVNTFSSQMATSSTMADIDSLRSSVQRLQADYSILRNRVANLQQSGPLAGNVILMGNSDAATIGATGSDSMVISRFVCTTTGPLSLIRLKSISPGDVKVALYTDGGDLLTYGYGVLHTGTGWGAITVSTVQVYAGNYYWLAHISNVGLVGLKSISSGTSKYWNVPYSDDWVFPDFLGSEFTATPVNVLIAGWSD